PDLHWLRSSCVMASFQASKLIRARKVSRAGRENASQKVLMVWATVSRSIGKWVHASPNGAPSSTLPKGCPPRHAFEQTLTRLPGTLHFARSKGLYPLSNQRSRWRDPTLFCVAKR